MNREEALYQTRRLLKKIKQNTRSVNRPSEKNIKSLYITMRKSAVAAQAWRDKNMTDTEESLYSDFIVWLDNE